MDLNRIEAVPLVASPCLRVACIGIGRCDGFDLPPTHTLRDEPAFGVRQQRATMAMTAHVAVHREAANLPGCRKLRGSETKPATCPSLPWRSRGWAARRNHGRTSAVPPRCRTRPAGCAARPRTARRRRASDRGCAARTPPVRLDGQTCRIVRTRTGSTLRALASRAGGGAASSVYVRSPWRAAANAGNRSAASACACSEGAAASASAWSMMRFESIRTVPSSQTSVGALTTGLIAANCAKPQTARSRK